MSIYLTIRTQSELDVRYDAPPPGRAHEGAVSLTVTDGVFAIFSSPDEVDDLAHKLLSQASKWRAALHGDSGRHHHTRAAAPDVDEHQADEPVAAAAGGYRTDPLADTLILYPDPAALQAQAAAAMGGDR